VRLDNGKCGETLPSTYTSHNHYGNLHVLQNPQLYQTEWMKPQFDKC